MQSFSLGFLRSRSLILLLIFDPPCFMVSFFWPSAPAFFGFCTVPSFPKGSLSVFGNADDTVLFESVVVKSEYVLTSLVPRSFFFSVASTFEVYFAFGVSSFFFYMDTVSTPYTLKISCIERELLWSERDISVVIQ